MKRSAPMKRAPLRATGPARTSVKVKKCAVKECRRPFTPISPWQVICSNSLTCACAWTEQETKKREAAAARKAKREAAEERAKDKAARERLKTIGQLESECRRIVQKIARIRDRKDGCISCHMGPNYGGQWHGSHYRAHGGCSSLQFNLWNIHKSCAQCNLFKSGNKEGFILGLLKKPRYGRERIDWLDSQPKSQRFTREYLERFKAVMGKRLRRMEKWQ